MSVAFVKPDFICMSCLRERPTPSGSQRFLTSCWSNAACRFLIVRTRDRKIEFCWLKVALMSRIVLQSERAGIDGSGDFAAAVGQMCSFPLGIPLPPQKAMTHLAQIKGMVSAVL
jgi:hypothetical protein